MPVQLVLAFAAALLIAGQPLAAGTVPAAAMGDRSGMGIGDAAGVVTLPSASPDGGPAAVPVGRGVLDDQAASVELNGYRWPLEHARITQAFGPSTSGLFVVAGARFHDGLDLANFCGAQILAAHDGVVIGAGRHVIGVSGWAGDVAGYEARLNEKNLWGGLALTVVIDDGNGYRSVYAHFHRIDVKVGDVVRAGDVIGVEGSTGHATGCHLHYSLFLANDPTRFETNPADVTRYYLPAAEIARVDPLSVMPPLEAGFITWGWGARDP